MKYHKAVIYVIVKKKTSIIEIAMSSMSEVVTNFFNFGQRSTLKFRKNRRVTFGHDPKQTWEIQTR